MYYYFYEYFADNPVIEFRLLGKEDEAPTLLDVTSFLYDFNLLYEISRLAVDPEYERIQMSRFAYFRKGRPLRDDDRLRVNRLRHESPIELVTGVAAVGGAIGAVWAVVQIVEKLANFKLNREKLKLEVEKARREQEKQAARPIVIIEEEEVNLRIQKREAAYLLENVERRLCNSTIKIETIEVHIRRRIHREESGGSEK